MEVTGVGAVVLLVLLFAPGLSSVLKSIAFRNRAAGKAKLIRAKGTAVGPVGTGRRTGERGGHG
ncbi:hypothetical protein AB0C98_28990 [Streptomyces sp. NPDC048558]|uniref:hypothetical protein n=1 Tax=Streptomyces sp. NPDC048558 TaxID=3155759 RepID=UPI00344A3526